MTTLLIKNVTLKGQEGLQQILIEDGQFKRIESNDVELNHNGDTIDAEGGMAVAPFCEPHSPRYNANRWRAKLEQLWHIV